MCRYSDHFWVSVFSRVLERMNFKTVYKWMIRTMNQCVACICACKNNMCTYVRSYHAGDGRQQWSWILDCAPLGNQARHSHPRVQILRQVPNSRRQNRRCASWARITGPIARSYILYRMLSKPSTKLFQLYVHTAHARAHTHTRQPASKSKLWNWTLVHSIPFELLPRKFLRNIQKSTVSCSMRESWLVLTRWSPP